MSISMSHRTIASVFGHRFHSTPACETAVKTRTDTSARTDAGELSCSPWEGLYLEQAHPAEGSAASSELESFLNSLMYGE
ncbi:hypothetical protein [Paenarthrobacter nitroguajacolicus]